MATLFLLTGDIQIGKTHWLQSQVDELTRLGVTVYGALAPGVWRGAASHLEKVAIDNVLLPQGYRIRFATRRDLLDSNELDTAIQSERAQLDWAISEGAIAQVNDHFDWIGETGGKIGNGGVGDDKIAGDKGTRGLLIVDELGRLELLHNGGLTSAIKLLAAGPSPAYRVACAIVRDYLLDQALERFSDIWDCQPISPDDAGRSALWRALDL